MRGPALLREAIIWNDLRPDDTVGNASTRCRQRGRGTKSSALDLCLCSSEPAVLSFIHPHGPLNPHRVYYWRPIRRNAGHMVHLHEDVVTRDGKWSCGTGCCSTKRSKEILVICSQFSWRPTGSIVQLMLLIIILSTFSLLFTACCQKTKALLHLAECVVTYLEEVYECPLWHHRGVESSWKVEHAKEVKGPSSLFL